MSLPNQNFFQFENLLVKLAGSGIDFAVTGGVAISLNGFVRATDDVDILVGKSPENLRRLLGCLTEWGQGFARELKLEDFVDEPGCIRVREDFDLDIFLQLREKSLDDFRAHLRFFEVAGVRIAYLSPVDLIFLKEGSWREKDRLDVAAMKATLLRESGTD